MIRCCILQCLIWVYTIYAGLSIRILRVNTVATEKILDVLTLVLVKKMLVCITANVWLSKDRWERSLVIIWIGCSVSVIRVIAPDLQARGHVMESYNGNEWVLTLSLIFTLTSLTSSSQGTKP